MKKNRAVNLTQEQSSTIRDIFSNTSSLSCSELDTIREEILSLYIHNELDPIHSCLIGMSLSNLVRALYNGVNPTMDAKLGDFVTHNPSGITRKVNDISSDHVTIEDVTSISSDIQYKPKFISYPITDFTQATIYDAEKEESRLWWAKRGLQRWELNKDDVLTSLLTDEYYYFSHNEDKVDDDEINNQVISESAVYYFSDRDFKCNKNDMDSNFEVFTFAKDRQDL